MAIRINNAKDFAGRIYLNTDDLARLNTILGIGSAATAATPSKIVTTDTNGHFVYTNAIVETVAADGTAVNTNIPTEAAVRTAIDAVSLAAIEVSAGNGIAVTSTGTTREIATDLTIAKLTSATEGYAASYQLKDGKGNVYGDTINIVKDQFLKEGSLVYGTAAALTSNGTITGENTEGASYPFLKLEMYAKSTAEGETSTSTIYIPVDQLYHDKSAGDGIAINANVVSVKIDDNSEEVYTAAGTTAAVLSVGENGVKVDNIQAAIDYAVTAEHSVAASAVTALNSKINSLATSANAAVTALNTRIVDVASNAEAAVSTLETEINALDSKVDTAFASADTVIENAVTSAMTNVENAVKTHTANAVQMLVDSATIPVGTKNTYTFNAGDTATICIVAVYDSGMQQIYPEIKKDGNQFKISADFGTTGTAEAETWTYLYTKALTPYSAAAVTVPDVSYSVTPTAAKTVENGTPAGEVSATADVTKSAPSYED